MDNASERDNPSCATGGQPAAWLGVTERILTIGILAACNLAGLGQDSWVLHRFNGTDGGAPWGTLALSDGVIYGTAVNGGESDNGTLFRLDTNGIDFSVLMRLSGINGSQNPFAGMLLSGPTLYGTTYGSVFKINVNGTGYSVLHQLSNNEGQMPQCTLLLANSTLFGTARLGGNSGCGTIFKLNTDGSGFTVLKQFLGVGDGAYPVSGLALSGSTLFGGTTSGGSTGNGVLFAINTDGSGYRLVKDFTGLDGSWPSGPFALSGSVLYGTTRYGGSQLGSAAGLGTIFRVNTDGTAFGILKNFANGEYLGEDPCGGVVCTGWALYGTLVRGGNGGYGAVYQINTNGSNFKVLRHFMGGTDGALPYGGLLFSDGVLYGTTSQGGGFDRGVIFAVSVPIPTILRTPTSQTAEQGALVLLSAVTGPDPPPTYQWLFNGTNLLSEPSTNSELRLTNTEFSQAGIYAVIISNAFGSVTSAPVTLNVIPRVERRWVPGIILTAQTGDVLNLEAAEVLYLVPKWIPLGSLILTNDFQWYFDLATPLSPERFYRASQNGATIAPVLDLYTIPALILRGPVGTSLRIEGINQFGPTDAWFPLATVTLSNTNPLYFDTSVVGKPPRLWRMIPLP